MPFTVVHSCMLTCRATTADPLEQETVPMARSDDATLVDLMQAVSEEAANEVETLAAMIHLLTSGEVRLSDEAIRAIRDLCAPAAAAA
jgi:hypothetical protein